MVYLKRPDWWLRDEPLVNVMPNTTDGFSEVNLELGGRIIATEVIDNSDAVFASMTKFQAIIDGIASRNESEVAWEMGDV